MATPELEKRALTLASACCFDLPVITQNCYGHLPDRTNIIALVRTKKTLLTS